MKNTKIRTNRDNLPMIVMEGEIINQISNSKWDVTPEGKPVVLPGMGGICLNVALGDKVFGWEADHLQPDVSIKHFGRGSMEDELSNCGLQAYSCIGNRVYTKERRRTGKVKKGFVTGKHGGVNYVIAHFSKYDKCGLSIGQHIAVITYGQGFKLLDYPDIRILNIDPDLFENIPVKTERNTLSFPVKMRIPANLMGSGLGDNEIFAGDFDIMTSDPHTRSIFQKSDLRFGDLVAIDNYDCVYGRSYREGAVSIGVIIHGDCVVSGHGPGVTIIASSKNLDTDKGRLDYHISKNSNIKNWFKGKK